MVMIFARYPVGSSMGVLKPGILEGMATKINFFGRVSIRGLARSVEKLRYDSKVSEAQPAVPFTNCPILGAAPVRR